MRVFLFLLLFTLIPPAWAAEEIYICPMHPHITGQAGDSCPICGMSLVPKVDKRPTESGPAAMSMPEDSIQISPAYMQALGIEIAKVMRHEFGESIRAFGSVEPSTRLEHVFAVRADGWIVDLAASAVGDTVKKGDLLFTYYSPDLMAAQSDYLIGSRIGNPAQRLRLFGMDDKAIALLKERGDMMEETPFYAPVNGTVTALNAREGAYMAAGAPVLTLQDFSKVWINAAVPLRDIGFLAVGQEAVITFPETGASYPAEIDFIHPVADPESRTVTVRLVVENLDGALKPETYADIVFNGNIQSRLAVPQEAVLYGSDGAYVFEALGDGFFRPVMVETGITSNGLTEITAGLNQGQHIVTSGQFMIDAESNLRGGMAAMGMAGSHDHGAPETPSTEMNNMDMPMDMNQQEESGHVH